MCRIRPLDKRLIVLWALVVLGYAALFVASNPLWVMPREEQVAIFEEVTRRLCHREVEDALHRTARRHHLPPRSVSVIMHYGYAQGWEPASCEEEQALP